MCLIRYTMHGYMQLSLAHFKCHEEISDSPTTRFRVTLHRCFGEHLESFFRKKQPMDDNAHARCTQEEVLCTFTTYWILANQKSQHAQLSFSVSPHFADSLGPNTRGLYILICWPLLERWDSFTAGHICNICLYSFRVA